MVTSEKNDINFKYRKRFKCDSNCQYYLWTYVWRYNSWEILVTIHPPIQVIKRLEWFSLTLWLRVTGCWAASLITIVFLILFLLPLGRSLDLVSPPEIDSYIRIKVFQWTVLGAYHQQIFKGIIGKRSPFIGLYNVKLRKDSLKLPISSRKESRSSTKTSRLAQSEAHGAWKSHHQTAQ